MKKILFPTDFSPETARALPVAAQLARQLHASLQLVHVLSGTSPGYAPRLHDANEQHRQALGRVELLFDDLLTLPCLQNLTVHTYVLVDADPTAIFSDEQLASADILVVASTGASGIREALFGSNAEHLIRQANMPVLVLKNPPAYLNLKTVVFASDFREPFEASINLMNDWFDTFDFPTVHLLFVNTPGHFVSTEEGRSRMETFAARYRLGVCTLNQLDAYDVEEGLLAFAQEKKADLIVLGTHGHRGLRHLLQGSVAEDVANHAPLPVLTLPLKPEHTPLVILEGTGTTWL
ncbi:universal stress protein [Fibrella sp. HMF5335]|uniref:Universal stress protein n=1 Tax=Fibrella rubiginis TaxID=2817060 RepID=A0A939GAE3_9BACT|nr:universal stress protein [Fibrella rubiginis]MBO0935412.1 universal stress protein [Fibrella rubiginis]